MASDESHCFARAFLDCAPVSGRYAMFPTGVVPAISTYEVNGWYFLIDGHYRVALAHQLQMEYIDAEVTAITTSHALTPDVDVRQLTTPNSTGSSRSEAGCWSAIPRRRSNSVVRVVTPRFLILWRRTHTSSAFGRESWCPWRRRPRTGTRPNTFPRLLRFTRLSSRRHTNTRPRATSTSACRPSAASCARRTGMRWADAALAARREGSHAASGGHSGRNGGGPFHAGGKLFTRDRHVPRELVLGHGQRTH
jgi:hypothetical protein